MATDKAKDDKMAACQIKTVKCRKIGWKNVSKNVQCFGWTPASAEEITTIKEKLDYYEVSGSFDENMHFSGTATPHITTSTKTRVWLSFYRIPADFSNLPAIAPLELLYNIFFLIRKILGTILPWLLFATFAVAIILSGSPFDAQDYYLLLGYAWMICFGGWLVCIFLDFLFARIAKAILRQK